VCSSDLPAIARLLRHPPASLIQVGYEALVRDPTLELARVFEFLGLPNEPHAVDYGQHFDSMRPGMGDPITVQSQSRPVDTSIDKWLPELASDPAKLALAAEIVAALDADDVCLWGFAKDQLLAPVENAQTGQYARRKANNYMWQRRIMLALKRDIRHRPHGKLVERVRYYCNVLLRE
jgi:hypothetical protein